MATDTSTTNLAPPGFRTIERLGIGTVFEVARVLDAQGRELICKRAIDARFAPALDRERDALTLGHRLAPFPELVASGHHAGGGFLVETRARGTPLRQWLEAPLPPRAAHWIAVARATTRALADLHAWGDAKGPLRFVHGDISPDNLFFEPPATVTFIDFSSATWRDAPRPALPGDRGTVPYAAPELTRQEVQATPETDTYALAATLLALAVGPRIVGATTGAGRLFETGSQGLLWKRIDERTDLPAELRSALAEALQFEPSSRLTSSHDLRALFQSPSLKPRE
jgi:serine/threonine protein kinase